MTDFLLELRSEEIPARMQDSALQNLIGDLDDALHAAGITIGSNQTQGFVTPRRLAVIVRDLPLETQPITEETKGPKVGAPPQAMEGFLRKVGLTQEQLVERDGVYFAVVEKPGRKTADVLAEAIPAIVRAFPWPKSQRWGAASISTESLRWVRPLQGIVALLGDDVVPCAVDGIVSGSATKGHRFHHSGEVTIGNAGDYAMKLRAAHVIVDQEERRSIIRAGAEKAAADAGLVLVPDLGLVNENSGLTEWPVPMLGRFDPAYLEVPEEVIQLTARVNQKYFVCHDTDGKLANAFVCTANIVANDGGAAIVAGNEKVLAARLSDAKFFWEQDLKIPLDEQAKKLSQITFHEKLGTVADKVERVAKLARWLVEEGIISLPQGETAMRSMAERNEISDLSGSSPDGVGRPLPAGEVLDRAALADMAERAARLCKADLVTGMVGEFPELQGIMGGYYARAQGDGTREADAVADAIRDHYKPVGQGDDVPTAPVTVAVSLADKLDSLITFFGEAMEPTGSKDPFALRRAAIAVLATVFESQLRGSIWDALIEARFIRVEQYGQREFERLLEITRHNHSLLIDSLAELEVAQETEFPHLFDIMDRSSEIEERYPENEARLQAITSAYVSRLTHVENQASRLVSERTLAFLIDRLKVQQREAGVRHDLIDAVFALGGEDDLVRLLARVKALQGFVGTDEGANLLAGYKRAANILKSSPIGGGGPAKLVEGHGEVVPPPKAEEDQPVPLHHPSDGPPPRSGEELALLTALDTAEPKAAAAIEAERFEDAMAALASLRAPIDAFFDGVMVNDPDPAKRAFRLGLLARFRDAVHRVADFSRIEG